MMFKHLWGHQPSEMNLTCESGFRRGLNPCFSIMCHTQESAEVECSGLMLLGASFRNSSDIDPHFSGVMENALCVMTDLFLCDDTNPQENVRHCTCTSSERNVIICNEVGIFNSRHQWRKRSCHDWEQVVISAAPLWTSGKTAAVLDLLYTDLTTNSNISDLFLTNRVRKERYVASKVRPVHNKTCQYMGHRTHTKKKMSCTVWCNVERVFLFVTNRGRCSTRNHERPGRTCYSN